MDIQLETGGVVSESRKDSGSGRLARVEECMARVVKQLDPTGPRRSTDRTPYRVAKMFLDELCAGYDVDVERLFESTFDNEEYDGMVVVHNIPIYSLCEHHLLLITGKAHVGYIPNDQVLGLSKVARVVEAYAKRLQLQERLTKQVADAIDDHLDPLGVIVVIEAEHMCLSIRGAQKPGTITTTSAIRGAYTKPETGAREEFFRLIGK
jgi:GTP cyclohydrolase IA